MFEGDWDELDAAATLGAAVECDVAENHAALGKLRAALHFADLHGELRAVSQSARTVPGGERLKVYGGDGCPAVAEFAPAEYAAVLGLTTRTGTAYIGDALALRHRFPRVWARTLAEQTLVWRARAVARRCLTLSLEAAAFVDQRIVATIDNLSTFRFYELLDTLITRADPDAARRAAEERAKDRGVFVNPSDGEGTKTVYVKAATGDVIRFDATICDLAWAMAVMGDTDTVDQRRAKAIGWIADPAAAFELLTAARYLAAQHHNGTTSPGAACHATCNGTCTTADSKDCSPADEPGMETGTGQDAGRPSAGGHHDRDQADAAVHDLGEESFPANEPGTGEDWFPVDEPGLEDQADRDTPHPSTNEHLDQLDKLTTGDILKAIAGQAWRHPRLHDDGASTGGETVPPAPPPGPPPKHEDSDTAAPRGTGLPSTSRSPAGQGDAAGESSDDASITCAASAGGSGDADGVAAGGAELFSRRGLADRLAAIKQAAYVSGLGATGTRGRPRTVLYVHLTDESLLSGQGIVRVEEYGALLTGQLRELLGHDQVVLKPVIDLNDKISVNAYEIPSRIRERVKLMHPVERFPFGTTETTMHTDLDHVVAYDPTGPPGQTCTGSVSPLGRFHHRLKTGGDWRVEQTDDGALWWVSPNGFQFRIDHNGTHRITDTESESEDD